MDFQLNQQKTDKVYNWQCRLREYVKSHHPVLQIGTPCFHIYQSNIEYAFIKWQIPVKNPIFIDVKWWPVITFWETGDDPVEVPDAWFWHVDERCEYRIIRMDRDFCFYLRGNEDNEISGVIKMPKSDADRLDHITVESGRSEYDPSRFLPSWGPNLAVRSDRIERGGRLIGVHPRENIVNNEYCSQELTPVVVFLDQGNNAIKEVICDRWTIPARTGATFGRYIPLKKEIAARVHRFGIQFRDPKCLFQETDKLVRVEGRKSQYVSDEDGKPAYEYKAELFNDGFEFAQLTVEYRLFYNTRTPEDPVRQETFDLPPRSALKIQAIFPIRQIENGEFNLLHAVPVSVEWDDLWQIPK